MTLDRNKEYLIGLFNELRKLTNETAWVEFKVNYVDPEEMGEYISALSNSAALEGKANAYLIWGVEDKQHEILGTTFRPSKAKKGNEELESWLLRLLNPRLHFHFHEIQIDDKSVVLLEISRAIANPVQFKGQEFIRIGSSKKKLKDYPEIERQLWRIFDQTPFEDLIAADQLDENDVLAILDYPGYFDLLGKELPADREKILMALEADNMVKHNEIGSWDITNLGAILFAKDLNRFNDLARKVMRVIVYDGKGRLRTIREQISKNGYASSFEDLIEYVKALLPRNEVIAKALRADVPMYSDIAVRELVANALIHQDFSVTGSGPMIEIFDDRMEITNPGEPLVETVRFLDTPPRSRNETLASFMRRIGVCEERGSGIDKVVFETEFFQLPAPSFEAPDGHTRSVLYSHRPLRKMDKNDRIRACYLHSCLRFVERDPMSNASLRERFGIKTQNSAMASRIIRDTTDAGLIKPHDPTQGRKHAKYVPFWA